MTHPVRLAVFSHAPAAFKALINLSGTVHKGPLGARLLELVQLRLSQINGCGFCVDMHWRALMKQEIDPRHLNALAVWREAPFFSERERAALAWSELVNAIPLKEPADEDFTLLQQHFTNEEIVELGYAIATIRAWNSLNVSFRNPIPAQPLPGF